MQKNGRRSRPFFHVLVLTRTIETRCKQAYKPGSVLTAIYLDLPLPISSSHLLGTAGQASCSPTVLLRIEFTGPSCSQSAGELLPHLSTLTRQACGISLLHFPWGHPRRVLPGTLPYGARTFLTPFGARPPGNLTNGRHYSINVIRCQTFYGDSFRQPLSDFRHSACLLPALKEGAFGL